MVYLYPAYMALASVSAGWWDVALSALVAALSSGLTSRALMGLAGDRYEHYAPLVATVVAAVWLLVASLTLLVAGLLEVSQ